MYLCFETIQLLDGTPGNLPYHQKRFERTRLALFKQKRHPLLKEIIDVPEEYQRGLLKCRVIYGTGIERIEFGPAIRHEIHTLRLVYSDDVEYSYKFLDRSMLEKLFLQKRGCDDILIVKNGTITDSFYANVLLWDGRKWYTPDTPLLPGTMRANLLDQGIIKEARITPDDLNRFKKVKLVNSLNDFTRAPEIPLSSIEVPGNSGE